MSAPTNTIKIDRSGMSLADLVVSGTRAGSLFGIIKYIPPALIPRVAYQPGGGSIHGDEATQWSYQQGILGFDWIPLGANAATETAIQAAYAEMAAAIVQFPYEITTQVNGAPEQVWAADPGQIAFGGSDGRQFIDMNFRVPIYAVTIPVYPIAGA